MPCQLSAYQKALCQLAEGEVQTEEACKEPQALKRMNNTLMELRTICNHPLIRCILLLLLLLLLLLQHLPEMVAFSYNSPTQTVVQKVASQNLHCSRKTTVCREMC